MFNTVEHPVVECRVSHVAVRGDMSTEVPEIVDHLYFRIGCDPSRVRKPGVSKFSELVKFRLLEGATMAPMSCRYR